MLGLNLLGSASRECQFPAVMLDVEGQANCLSEQEHVCALCPRGYSHPAKELWYTDAFDWPLPRSFSSGVIANGCWLGLGWLSLFSFIKRRHPFTAESLDSLMFYTEQLTVSTCNDLRLRDLNQCGGEGTWIILTVDDVKIWIFTRCGLEHPMWLGRTATLKYNVSAIILYILSNTWSKIHSV